MEKHTIRLHPIGKELQVNDQTPLIDVLHEFGIEFPCGGKGTCGKCKVRLLDGEIAITEIHRQKLDQLGLSPDWRLSCYSLCTNDITLEIEQFNHLILADESEFEFSPRQGFGVAVDLGTTTIVAQLVDLSSSKVMAVETMLNPQVKFGADLISRIQACLDGHEAEMTGIVRSSIGILIRLMLKKYDVRLQKIVLVGNAAMQLIFSNCDVIPLSAYPFHINDPGLKTFKTEELGWDFDVKENVQFYPSIGSFVGSDILAGIAATGLYLKENYTALIDLGTNGEIVIGNKNRVVCASTAAGPAFEGANISMGMRAVTGAISSLRLVDGKIEASVIGNTAPKGICGSALIDAIALLRKMELIGIFGEINSGESQITIAGKVILTQRDINEFQLAKAAIAAGLTILARTLSIDLTDIEEIYIAGAFGSYINIENVVETGMIELPAEKIHKMGNTALIGAKMFLFSDMGIADKILAKTTHISLEADPNFQDIYVDKLLFP
ncbi:MAG TPA: ASKHA domain-containing protein [Prolixibacteraceae bacterium]|nr:ASKHA domain-containing protein [Prolixibacteraceae bacterium]